MARNDDDGAQALTSSSTGSSTDAHAMPLLPSAPVDSLPHSLSAAAAAAPPPPPLQSGTAMHLRFVDTERKTLCIGEDGFAAQSSGGSDQYQTHYDHWLGIAQGEVAWEALQAVEHPSIHMKMCCTDASIRVI